MWVLDMGGKLTVMSAYLDLQEKERLLDNLAAQLFGRVRYLKG